MVELSNLGDGLQEGRPECWVRLELFCIASELDGIEAELSRAGDTLETEDTVQAIRAHLTGAISAFSRLRHLVTELVPVEKAQRSHQKS